MSDPFNSVQDPNKIPGWPPVADPSAPPREYDNAVPSHYPKPSTLPSFPKPVPPPPPPPAVEVTAVPAVGAYKDSGYDLKELPATTLRSSQEAADRMAMLKMRVNELQDVRAGYWRKQGVAAAAGLTTAVLSLGVGLLASGAAGVHQRNKLEQVKKVIRTVLSQVNMLRTHFPHDPAVLRAEKKVRITESVFSKDIHRNELSGDL